ncbi:hypothetical protein EJ08DRAFT_640570 [Tothia fuscella]|uniref:DUF985 domain-containing protein n=1 Tax=Tothia fuscella TaxID=1048955 RepID=A0A9P4NIE0_9PEZI|nr:hypothetical protein EJ08DRAFT_640570 [Tothia fuscella]
MSPLDPSLLHSNFVFPNQSTKQDETPKIHELIERLNLQEHVEGGYFAETDRVERLVPNPFRTDSTDPDVTRAASTSIFYLITPKSPIGYFHRNKGRTVHTLHSGRARYVLIHPPRRNDDGAKGKHWRIETLAVGRDLAKGENMQWIVDGGVWKTSFLLENEDGGEHSATIDCTSCGGCLISETVIPGFEFADHEFLDKNTLNDLVGVETATDLSWLVRKS